MGYCRFMVDFRRGQQINLCPKCRGWSWDSHSLLFKEYRGIFPRYKAAGVRKPTRHVHLVSNYDYCLSLHFTLACISRYKHYAVCLFVWVIHKLSAFLLFCFDVHVHHTADMNSVCHGKYVTCYVADHNDCNKKNPVIPHVFSCCIPICGSN